MNKKIVYNFIVVLVLIFISNKIYSQHISDTIELKSVTIQSKAVYKPRVLKTTFFDSIVVKQYESTSLSQLLASHSPVFIKSYGQGNLATVSFRGTGASHTQVLWNDLSINSPMIGQTDFSLIPVFLNEELSLLHGSSSLFQHSGSLGGTIQIGNKPDFSERLKVQALIGTGSFETYNSGLNINFGNGKFLSKTKIYGLKSENNFSFKNNTYALPYPEEIRNDASYWQEAIMQEFYFKNSSNIESGVRFWWQKNFRKLPQPLVMTAIKGNESQESESIKMNAFVKKTTPKYQTNLSVSYLNDLMIYDNRVSFIHSQNRVNQGSFKAGLLFFGKPGLRLRTGLDGEIIQVNSINYSGFKKRSLFSAYIDARYEIHKRWVVVALLREELLNGEFQSLIPSLGIEYKLSRTKDWYVKTMVARNLHQPSMNDLYWVPGGNPDLKHEDGLTAEASFEIRSSEKSNPKFETEFTSYFTHINNWILWQPDAVSRYWKPVNLKQVNSSGLEYMFHVKYELSKCIFTLQGGYTFTAALNKKELYPNDPTVGKQLIYVPRNSVYGNIAGSYQNWNLTFNTHWVGKRYTSTSNTRYLPDYFVSDLCLSKRFKMVKQEWSLQVSIDNIFDEDYQSVAWQPMPGRSFSVTLRYQFLKTQSNE